MLEMLQVCLDPPMRGKMLECESQSLTAQLCMTVRTVCESGSLLFCHTVTARTIPKAEQHLGINYRTSWRTEVWFLSL